MMRSLQRLVGYTASNGGRLFRAIFFTLAVLTVQMIARNPFLSGQDYHYHLMSAALAVQGWTTHAFPSVLYHRVNPLDANTLLYVLVAPFELVASPLRAFSLATLLYYFLGFPLACACALRIMRRPLWGALLAFPCAYVKSLFGYGYMPFVAAAPLFVLGLAAMHRVLSLDAADDKSTRRTLGLSAALFVVAFLAHAHVHAWLLAVCALVTVVAIGRRLSVDFLRDRGRAVRDAARTSVRALAVVAPSVGLAFAWSMRLRNGSSSPLVPSTSTLQAKLETLASQLVQTRADDEWMYIGAFGLVVIFALLVVRRSSALPMPELALVTTIASAILLPWAVDGQSVAPRQLDLAIWILPLVVYPTPATKATRGRHAWVVAAMTTFAVLRLLHVEHALLGLQREMAGLVELTKQCPPGPAEVAYVTSTKESTHMAGFSLHQAHETFAALCRLDTPVYDTTKPAYRVAPLRYDGPLPAPVTIVVNEPNWYVRDGLWKHFEYVLVYKWVATDLQREWAARSSERIAVSGDWELWRRRARP